VKILAKMSLKHCIISYDIFMRKNRFLVIGKSKQQYKNIESINLIIYIIYLSHRSWYLARSIK